MVDKIVMIRKNHSNGLNALHNLVMRMHNFVLPTIITTIRRILLKHLNGIINLLNRDMDLEN